MARKTPREKTKFSENFKQVLAEQNLKQSEVAKILGLSGSVVHEWTRGSKPHRTDLIHDFCELYGVDFEWLLTGCKKGTPDKKEPEVIEISCLTELSDRTSRCIKQLREHIDAGNKVIWKDIDFSKPCGLLYLEGMEMAMELESNFRQSRAKGSGSGRPKINLLDRLIIAKSFRYLKERGLGFQKSKEVFDVVFERSYSVGSIVTFHQEHLSEDLKGIKIPQEELDKAMASL